MLDSVPRTVLRTGPTEPMPALGSVLIGEAVRKDMLFSLMMSFMRMGRYKAFMVERMMFSPIGVN